MSGATEGIGVMTIGTASKGIIDRNFQHNAQVPFLLLPLLLPSLPPCPVQVYRQMYAPNPFASETDEDIAKYMSEVSRPPSLPIEKGSGGLVGPEGEGQIPAAGHRHRRRPPQQQARQPHRHREPQRRFSPCLLILPHPLSGISPLSKPGEGTVILPSPVLSFPYTPLGLPHSKCT